MNTRYVLLQVIQVLVNSLQALVVTSQTEVCATRLLTGGNLPGLRLVLYLEGFRYHSRQTILLTMTLGSFALGIRSEDEKS